MTGPIRVRTSLSTGWAIASHIRAMAVELGKKTVEEREWRFDYGKPMSAVEYYKHAKTQS